MMPHIRPCHKCGSNEFGYYTSASTGKQHRYCRVCRRERAMLYDLRKAVSGGRHTRRQWLEKLAMYEACPRCGRLWADILRRSDRRYKYVWTEDHIIPVTEGGTDDIENIQPLCYQCNSSKCNRDSS